jgi:peptide deformylase
VSSLIPQLETAIKHIKMESIKDPLKQEIDEYLASLESEFIFVEAHMNKDWRISRNAVLVSDYDKCGILSRKAGLWTEVSDTIRDLFERMKFFVLENSDIEAISLPQLGVPYQGFVCRVGRNKVKAFVNPHIEENLGRKIAGTLTCLSSNDEMLYEYYESVVLSYRDVYFKQQYQKFSGERALIVQHMCDHLHGKLIFE